MRKLGKLALTLALVALCAWLGTVFADRQALGRDIIRLHVVGASDREEDQAEKLRVRDGILAFLARQETSPRDAAQARAFLEEILPELEAEANRILARGSGAEARITLGEEAFPKRVYDTFTLPSGMYESLRVTIGEGAGRNWWCVVFPQLCMPATAEDFRDTAVAAGFSDSLTDSLTGDYELRFFLLDCLGKLETWLR